MSAHETSLLDFDGENDAFVDFLQELKYRTWARQNYAPRGERSQTWHPIVLDEMARRDSEMSGPIS